MSKNEYGGDVRNRGSRTSDSTPSSQSSTSRRYFATSDQITAAKSRSCHKDLDPKGKIRECRDNEKDPEARALVVLSDVTRSRGKDVDVIYKKLPRLMGKNAQLGLFPGMTISMSAVGDATAGDIAPLQIGQFERDNRLDDVLTKIWSEGGGGGTGQESYQLGAFFFARQVVTDDWEKRKQKGIMFILGDEGFYPTVSRAEVKRILGVDISEDIPSTEIFRELQERFDVYLVFPRKSWEERKGDIDKEIEQRVKEAGGMYDEVDIRFSLIWYNRNDLDLHVITPSGEHIFYNSKVARCGGNLDVDRNVQGETTKPVENTRWAKGKGKKGTYEVYVENYRFHENNENATPFKVEIAINGQVTHIEGETPARRNHDQSRVLIGKFYFDPEEAKTEEAIDRYALYNDEVVLAQWRSVIPAENILVIQDPAAIVDTILAVLAVKYKGMSLDNYLKILVDDEQTPTRIQDVTMAVSALAEIAGAPKVDFVDTPSISPLKKRRSSKVL
jgi:hypothetical protein